jgi:hypothetical protein
VKDKTIMLEDRTARLTILVDPDKKRAFEDLCAQLDTTPSQALRQMIREFLMQHNVTWKTGNDRARSKK